MPANSFGEHFVLHSFGESHGTALGVVIDGCPAGIVVDEALLLKELERRRPGQIGSNQQFVVSTRQEEDRPEILSGVFEGKTLGTPIAVIVRNQNQKSADYDEIKKAPRAGHADDVWKSKFGHSDHRGGGRSSGRETLSRVIAGSFARMLLNQAAPKMKIVGFASQIGPLLLGSEEEIQFLTNSDASAETFVARFPSAAQQQKVSDLLTSAKSSGESWGGIAKIVVQNPSAGLGQPVFHKLKSDLAAALMSVGAVVGVEVGAGFSSVDRPGTEFHRGSQDVYGGIRGGISTGDDIVVKVAIKPTSSILDVSKKGRHDPCIVTRAIPVLEAMVAIVLADHTLLSRMDQA
jgi:chorismate synthase